MYVKVKRILLLCISLFLLCNLIFSESTSSHKEKDRPSVALVFAGGGAKVYALIPFIELIELLEIGRAHF